MVRNDAFAQPEAVRQAPHRRPLILIALLGAFQMLGPLSVDMYLPGLPALQQSLHASQADVQWTLAGFIFGLSVGQLFWGPLSDSFGRRPPLLGGLLIYVLASTACAATASILELQFFRFAQAAGASAAAVMGSAMIRDLYERDQGARIRSLAGIASVLATLGAPILGAELVRRLSWRAIFALLAVVGTFTFAGALTLPETLPVRSRSALKIVRVLRNYFALAADRRYLCYGASSGLVLAGTFSFIAASPFVYMGYFGVPVQYFGLMFVPNLVGLMVTGYLNSMLVRRIGAIRLLRIGLTISAGAGLSSVALGCLLPHDLATLMIAVGVFVASMGLVASNAVSAALVDFMDRAGLAAAFIGALVMSLGAFATVITGWTADGTPRPMTELMAVCGLGALLVNLISAPHG